jgi:hypothetical protein
VTDSLGSTLAAAISCTSSLVFWMLADMESIWDDVSSSLEASSLAACDSDCAVDDTWFTAAALTLSLSLSNTPW